MELERLGKYELLERLGQGGMGEVWKARDTQLQRFVAIKLLHADLQAQPDFVTHFMREARFVASLHHPNIVQIHDFELTNTQGSRARAYMVMDYIEGGTLADYMRTTVRKGFYPPATDIVDLFAAISLALDYAHRQGMIHRDIKPANILLDKTTRGNALGEPILTDFGIARLQGASSSTITSALIGTPLYISPEQAEDKPVDERSDLYSLGIVLYEMLTGVTPFRGDSPIAIMMQHVHMQPASPALINSRISPALSAVVLQSIAKEPKDRFSSATAMTLSLAQAFNMPLPASLSSTRSINERPAYNPLQPSMQPTGATSPPPTPALPIPPTVTFTPPSADLKSTPVDRLPKLPLPSGKPARPPHAQRKWLYVAAIACALIALIGVSAFSVFPRLFSQHAMASPTPNPTGGVVGHIVFVKSANASNNIFDQLRIDLSNILPPPSHTTYYAWLENSSSEASVFPHWALQILNGAVHGLYTSNSPHTDLFASNDWFLITAESSIPQFIPNAEPAMHIYYALITPTSTSSPTFEVKQCPPGSPTNAPGPCQ